MTHNIIKVDVQSRLELLVPFLNINQDRLFQMESTENQNYKFYESFYNDFHCSCPFSGQAENWIGYFNTRHDPASNSQSKYSGRHICLKREVEK
jgi:hypothetical protein